MAPWVCGVALAGAAFFSVLLAFVPVIGNVVNTSRTPAVPIDQLATQGYPSKPIRLIVPYAAEPWNPLFQGQSEIRSTPCFLNHGGMGLLRTESAQVKASNRIFWRKIDVIYDKDCKLGPRSPSVRLLRPRRQVPQAITEGASDECKYQHKRPYQPPRGLRICGASIAREPSYNHQQSCICSTNSHQPNRKP